MFETVPLVPYDSALIEALCEGNLSAWCFLPVEASEPAYCSGLFRTLWDLPPIAAEPSGKLPQRMLSEAFETAGVPAKEFFARVTGHYTDIPEEFQLLQNDETRILASVQCVFSNINGAAIGRIVHFRVLSDTNAISGLLDQISAARKKLEVLSKREMEILNLVYEGRTNKAISIMTEISEKTVEKHRSRIMLKLGLSCTTLMIRVITVARMLPGSTWAADKKSAEGQLEKLHVPSAAGLSLERPTSERAS